MARKDFSDKYIQSLKPRSGKYNVREARGFTIEVRPSGLKTFLYIYKFDGKRKPFILGPYPGTTLKVAREKYNDAYNLVQRGIDPKSTPNKRKQSNKSNSGSRK